MLHFCGDSGTVDESVRIPSHFPRLKSLVPFNGDLILEFGSDRKSRVDVYARNVHVHASRNELRALELKHRFRTYIAG